MIRRAFKYLINSRKINSTIHMNIPQLNTSWKMRALFSINNTQHLFEKLDNNKDENTFNEVIL